MPPAHSIYDQRISNYSVLISGLEKPLQWIPWGRLLLFVLAGLFLYYSIKSPGILWVALSCLAFTGFLLAGWGDSILKNRIRNLRQMIRINEQEILALQGDWSGFGSGLEFSSPDHPYSHDLDVFGPGSLYQYVNRTNTIFGSEKLADYFRNAFQYRHEIFPRQQAVAELAANIEFRQKLQLIFSDRDTSHSDLAALQVWLSDTRERIWIGRLKIVALILPLITITLTGLSLSGLVSWYLPGFMITLQLLIVMGSERKILMMHEQVGSRFKVLHKYSEALGMIEKAGFTSAYLTRLQENLNFDGSELPGSVIRRLAKLLKMLDSNLNLLVSILLNGAFMFNIHVLNSLEQWRTKYREKVPEWFAVLAELDALSSLGTFGFNHPHYRYPEVAGDDFQFIAEGIGHPLIPNGTCVTNDIEIRGWKQFRIVTGANMSGKSTFLRTVGVNLVLAMTGAPVFAARLVFRPVEIHSSIRTSDSLAKRESYFYAELKRLKEIITELEQGKQKLILLDEILKGTNSSDKQTGSIALIRQLMKYDLTGLFATHDLALGELMNHYPENIRNLCFEIMISGDRMEIDYKLRPGVCKNLNASFLMKNMGIILENDAQG
jgi:hypothetical protein